MKNLRVILGSLAMAAVMSGTFTACKDQLTEPNADGTVSAAAVIQVGNPAGGAGNITNIAVNTTWAAGNTYVLNGFVRVVSPATLTIQPGVIIQGDRATRGTLFIEQGGKISAVGTPTSPIVFTSEFPVGQRQPGDWGGVVILGRAPINITGQGNATPTIPAGQPAFPALPAGTNRIEGVLSKFVTAANNVGVYGGVVPADNSGIMRYVRIEYAGINTTDNNETNGLTFGGVGSGTTIDHIQVAYANDDSYEWFGGTVNCKYLFAYRGRDDDFDTDFGYSGKIQFAWGLRDPAIADNNKTTPEGVAINGSGSNGFESDNNNGPGNNGVPTTGNPRTKALFSNVTIIGPDRPAGVNPPIGPASGVLANTYSRGYTDFAGGGSGALIRRNSLMGLFNSVVVGYPKAQYNFTSPAASFSTTYTPNVTTTAFRNTVSFRSDNPVPAPLAPPLRSAFAPNPGIDFLNAGLVNKSLGGANMQTALNVSSAMWSLTAPNPRPNAGSLLLTAGTSYTGPVADPFFTPVTFRGAFGTDFGGWNLPNAWVRYFNLGQ